MQQYGAFGRLAKEGRAIEDIAAYFDATDLKVKRILALANLHEDIRALYAAEEMGSGRSWLSAPSRPGLVSCARLSDLQALAAISVVVRL